MSESLLPHMPYLSQNDLSTLLLCDDLSGEDHDNVSTNKEFGGYIL